MKYFCFEKYRILNLPQSLWNRHAQSELRFYRPWCEILKRKKKGMRIYSNQSVLTRRFGANDQNLRSPNSITAICQACQLSAFTKSKATHSANRKGNTKVCGWLDFTRLNEKNPGRSIVVLTTNVHGPKIDLVGTLHVPW